MGKTPLDVWKEFSQKFLSARNVPMTQEVAQVFMACLLGEAGADFPPQGLKDSFPYRVGDKRASHVGLNCSQAVLAFLCALSKSPGCMVMYIYALRYAQLDKEITRYSMSDLAEQFPIGFPSEKDLSELWDFQKGNAHDLKIDNCLDCLGEGSLTL